MKRDELVKIFYSGMAGQAIDYSAIDLVQVLLNNSVLDYRKISIASKERYAHYVEKIKGGKVSITELGGRQSAGHLALKMIAKDYQERFNKLVDFEVNHGGNVIDVLTKDCSIFIECGNTEPNKVFEYLSSAKVREVGILPYPEYESEALTLNQFLRGKNFVNYLNLMVTNQKEKLKKIIADLGSDL